ncbi:hypothetical protein BBI01_07240 [Chryseobacterium artocarpi]|uniref:Integrase n=1 Tax=Chryseobacterium artocarpi TaxID=1414727 RepID=A0A1B8ZK50_9FLAO|nr:hypothetical protein [Chryseobacterium artocarpi]OCA71944.1 hypothetical protein BBI01_07240 [Chryseobacterium artocarpi]
MNKPINEKNISNFIEKERKYFNTLPIKEDWDSIIWNTRDWLFHRGLGCNFFFNAHICKIADPNFAMPKDFADFTKSFILNISRNWQLGFGNIKSYLNLFRMLYTLMLKRNESSISNITRWHFDELIHNMQDNSLKYQTIYNNSTRLKRISDFIDQFKLSPIPIEFKNNVKCKDYTYTSISSMDFDDRIESKKLPSYEAIVAYAKCTNSPLNNYEAILLRTIDLIIATGLRANEILLLPYNCLIKKVRKDENGNILKNSNNKNIYDYCIKYYAQKSFRPQVHWLSEQDVPLVIRAINDLKTLTAEPRKIAKFQEDHNRLWNIPADKLIADSDLLKYFGHKNIESLNSFLKRQNISPKIINKDIVYSRLTDHKKKCPQHLYIAGEIENLFYKRVNHVALKHNNKTILKTSEVLSIRFVGCFGYYYDEQPKSMIKLLPSRTGIDQINVALGSRSIDSQKSIFDRRGLTEADGSRIKISSHQFRHWKNTLYELAGMSNINQALALGRENISQNKVYQHPTFEEYTKSHKEYLNFNTVDEKISFLRNGIRKKIIIGELTDTYHNIKEVESYENAETFLHTHGNALHITPFGACTNDFSLNPCEKHLQCWNACNNLHLTGLEHEWENLEKLIHITENSLEKLKQNGIEEYGANNWIMDLEAKLKNMKYVKELAIKGFNVQVFPNGNNLSEINKKTDIINGKQ